MAKEITRENFCELMWSLVREHSVRQIAAKYGASLPTVIRWLKNENAPAMFIRLMIAEDFEKEKGRMGTIVWEFMNEG